MTDIQTFFELWFIPTEEGKRAFKWAEHKLSTHTTRDGAVEERYFAECDEPAPDWRNYYHYEIREVV